jgi:hypothetical protein
MIHVAALLMLTVAPLQMIDTTPFYKMDRNEPTYSENFKKLLLHTLLGAVTKALDAEKIPAYKRRSNIHQRPQNVHEVQ